MLALNSLNDLAYRLRQSNHRYAIQLQLELSDASYLLSEFSRSQGFLSAEIAWLGGESASIASRYYSFKQGQQLLGQEVKMLIVDVSSGFDANSFNAALGALVGGGMVFIIHLDALESNLATIWLTKQLQPWPQVTALEDEFNLPNTSTDADVMEPFAQQATAITAIEKVVTGHRRRPLVINANRGRGKTASLGMAAAKLMTQRVMTIVVTAPAIKSLSPLFDFLERGVGTMPWQSKQPTHWVLSNGSQLRFVAPDELYLNQIDADLLLVDEAAALPLPMLKHFVEHYHRLVLSSTIHGYEGCGRGFTLKFMTWLEEHRPGCKQIELTQPIRWGENDPLEQWSFDAFLLHSDEQSTSEEGGIQARFAADNTLPDNIVLTDLNLQSVDKTQLVADPQLYAAIFGLLVNAHYQTSPNDVLQVLASDDIQVYQLTYPASGSQPSSLSCAKPSLVGCLLVSCEGGLSRDLIADIQTGKRRPKGHLAASHLANHLALYEPAVQTSARIMRIAIAPSWQGQGVGRYALAQLAEQLRDKVDYLSVSFGATAELVSFWKALFQFVALGSRRDHVSGCYSAFMVQPLSSSSKGWIKQAQRACMQNLKAVLPLQYQSIEHDTLAALLIEQSDSDEFVLPVILQNYAQGGNSFESVLPVFQTFMLQYLSYNADAHHQLRSPLLSVVIDKVVLFLSWQAVAQKHQLAGRKQIEQSLKQWLLQFTV